MTVGGDDGDDGAVTVAGGDNGVDDGDDDGGDGAGGGGDGVTTFARGDGVVVDGVCPRRLESRALRHRAVSDTAGGG